MGALMRDLRQPLGMVRPQGSFAFEHALLDCQVIEGPLVSFDRRGNRVLTDNCTNSRVAMFIR